MNFDGVLGNKTLRQAILMAIDYDTICNSKTIGGLYTPGFSVLPSNLSYGCLLYTSGKYLVIFLLLVATIGLVSGFLVADGSMIIAYNEGFEKYNVENGNFLLEKRANKAQIKAIEAAGVTLYENFYTEEALTNESTLRIFKNRQEVNKMCIRDRYGYLYGRSAEYFPYVL